MEQQKKDRLVEFARQIRHGIIEEVYHAKSGHPGGSLSISDMMAYLYEVQLKNIDPKNPRKSDRDRVVLSKGHTCPALYAALALKGYFPLDELKKFRAPNAMLQGHPDMKGTPGVDMSSGSLGQGLSAGVGMALSAKLDKKDYTTYVIVGDGEIQEGQIWEAAMFASHKKLDNLVVIVDNNNLQIDGEVCEVCSPYPIDEKFKAFGFEVIEIDAHDFTQMEEAFQTVDMIKDKPSCVILKSTKGKGVSFMENNVAWHGNAPSEEEYTQALTDIGGAKLW